MSLVETYSFWDGDIVHAMLLVLSNAALVPAIIYLTVLGDRITPLLFINTLVSSTFYHMCRAGVFCWYRYEMHRTSDYISVYMSIIWMLTMLGIRNMTLHVFAFFFCFIITTHFILGEASQMLLPIVGIGIPTLVSLVHAYAGHHRLFYRPFFSIATFVLAGTAGVFMFALSEDSYSWAHSIWHIFSMLAAWTFAIAITPRKQTSTTTKTRIKRN
jgi:hypothetical protein